MTQQPLDWDQPPEETPEEAEQEQADTSRLKRIIELAEGRAAEGDIEFDQLTEEDISEGDDNGCYVRAWLWISFEGTDLDKETDA